MRQDSKQSIIFRADGDNRTGLGHVIRTSALADMISDEYKCILATRCTIPSILKQLEQVFDEIINLPDLDYDMEAQGMQSLFATSGLLVLDGYYFDDKYQQVLKASGFDFFCIDDIHAYPFLSKAIINHSGGLSSKDYKARPSTQFYLGPQYALLRKPFLQAAKKRRTQVEDRNCFVCFGGADPHNKTLEVLRGIGSENKGFENIHVVVGGANIYVQEIEKYAAGNKNIFIYRSLSAEELVSIMQLCSYAICSPSTIVYEYMSVGGVVFLEQIADNQKDVKRYMTESGLAFPYNTIDKLSEEEMQLSLKKQSELFDGNSDQRYIKIFKQYFDTRKLSLRKAKLEDLQTCFNWANDPEVRRQSYNQSEITMEDHITWFNAKLNDRQSYFYILELDKTPVAQVRFQVSGQEAVLGYLADPLIRNKGFGTAILGRAIEKFVEDFQHPVHISGFVKRSNIASQRSFERLAFSKEDSTEYPDSFKYTMYYGN